MNGVVFYFDKLLKKKLYSKTAAFCNIEIDIFLIHIVKKVTIT